MSIQSIERGEARMASSTDWRSRYRKKPYAFLGGAFAGGVLLAVGTRSGSEAITNLIGSDAVGEEHRRQVVDAWNGIKGALIAVATARLVEYLGNLMPGFSEHFDRRMEQRPAD
jgi:hypothetical protein